MKKPKFRDERMTWRSFLSTMVSVLPMPLVPLLVDFADMPWWKGVLIYLAVGLVWLAVLGTATIVLRRVRHGVWSRKPVDSRVGTEGE